MDNIGLATRLIDRIRAMGADEFCVCAGSRNSPLLAVLGATAGARLFTFVDERSASFFAIGRIKLHGSPVAVVTTSGTAVAELLPAAIEAHYSGLPLILVTADRPAHFRGTGAPQSIDQIGIFGVHAETEIDRWSGVAPLHVNIEFDEPLIDGPIPERTLIGQVTSRPARRASNTSVSLPGSRPVVIIGGLPPKHRERVRDFAMKLGAPVYAEALSGLREDPELPLITSSERMIGRGRFDAVIRIGNVPTLRFWRDLEGLDLPVVHFSDLPFPGLTRGALHPIEALSAASERSNRDDRFFAEDRQRAEDIQSILDSEPDSELAMIRELSREIANGARVYLGNSLPVREWDLAATRESRGLIIEANRGANGIDGQLSTFFGQCDPERENVCLVGDLTTIYDLGAPWVVPQLGNIAFRIVIVNNGGGRIFSRVASLQSIDRPVRERLIENVHQVRFDPWAAMWNIETRVSELLPDAEATARVWQRYDALWAPALSDVEPGETESNG
jgi:2-succinyl-5-enolpyruvyl-6-hydroxy-3-cyclohexene-1-carboxylate synthase